MLSAGLGLALTVPWMTVEEQDGHGALPLKGKLFVSG